MIILWICWVIIKFVCMHACSVVSSLFVTLWIVACQAPLSMGFPRQKYWSGLPFSPPGDLTNPGIKPSSSTSPLVTGFCTTEPPGKPTIKYNSSINFVSSFLLFFFFFFLLLLLKSFKLCLWTTFDFYQTPLLSAVESDRSLFAS